MSKTLVSTASFALVTTLFGCATTDDTVAVLDHGDLPRAAAAVKSVSATGTVMSSEGAPLPGVSVCTRPDNDVGGDAITCADSSADGSFTITGLPAKRQVALTFEKEGFQPALRVFATGTEDVTFAPGESRLAPLSAQHTTMGGLANPDLGRIEFFIDPSGADSIPAVSVSALGSDGNVHEPVYEESQAHGFVINLPEGQYMLVFKAEAGCTASRMYGYPMFERPDSVPSAAIVDVPVLEGYVTTPVRVSCTGSASSVSP